MTREAFKASYIYDKARPVDEQIIEIANSLRGKGYEINHHEVCDNFITFRGLKPEGNKQ